MQQYSITEIRFRHEDAFFFLTVAACVLCRTRTESEEGQKGPAWVVGVEDFMRRFLPGRSNAKSIFALAQLNGIVKYACQKVRSITSTTACLPVHCCTMLSITNVLLCAFRFDECEIPCTKDRFEVCLLVLSLAPRALPYLLKKEEDHVCYLMGDILPMLPLLCCCRPWDTRSRVVMILL